MGDLSLSSLLQRTLADFEVAEMRKALEYVKRSVVNSQDADCSIVLTRLEYVETDFQSDGIRAAFIGWAADEFGFPVPEIRVRFVKSDNRYVFDWAALG
ncbi:hypothetical protein [Amycolatopsis sp. NPDC001319]|uniref:hypothetical protein n=1 Tax=unclassified Amycolatopsis TaxID=2618356 RepID=UPI0036800D2E